MSRWTFTQGSLTIHAIGWDPGLATFFLQLNAQYEEPRLWLSLNLRFWDRRRPQLAHFQLGLARSHPPTPDLTQPVI